MASRTSSLAATLCAAVLGAALVLSGVWQLESHRSHISTASLTVGTNTATPVTIYRRADSEGEKSPAVIVAHGFAGSRQLMEAFALTLARSGYVVASFDFEATDETRPRCPATSPASTERPGFSWPRPVV